MGSQSTEVKIQELVKAAPSDDIVEFHSVRELGLPLYWPAFLAWIARSMIIAVLPIHILELGYSYDDVGCLVGVLGFGSMICNVPTGMLIERYGPKAIVILSSMVMCFGAICGMVAYSFLMMGSACFFLGCGESSGILARTTLIGACVRSELRGRASSTLGGVSRMAYMIGPLIAGAVAQYRGARTVYLIQAVLSVFAAIMTQFLTPYVRSDQDLSGSPKKKVSKASASSPIDVIKAYWRVLFTVTFFVVCLSVLRKARELLFALVGHEAKLSQDQIGIVVSVSYTLDAMMFPLAGKLLDSVGRTRTGALTTTIFTSGILVLIGGGLWSYIAFAAVSGIANGLSAGLVITMGGDLAPADCRGQFLALYRTFGRVADLTAPLIVGVVAEYSSLRMAQLVICLVGLIGAAWILGCVQETLRSSSKQGGAATHADRSAEVLPKPTRVGKYAELNDDEEELAKLPEPFKVGKYAELNNDDEDETTDAKDVSVVVGDDDTEFVEDSDRVNEALCHEQQIGAPKDCSSEAAEVQLEVFGSQSRFADFGEDDQQRRDAVVNVDTERTQ